MASQVCVNGVCVFTAVCALWMGKCRARIPSMGHHTWLCTILSTNVLITEMIGSCFQNAGHICAWLFRFRFDFKLKRTVLHLFVLYLSAYVLKEGLLKLAPSGTITCCDTKNTSPPTTKELKECQQCVLCALYGLSATIPHCCGKSSDVVERNENSHTFIKLMNKPSQISRSWMRP